MQLIRDLVAGPVRGAVLAIGNFDGVHPGHVRVIETAAARAQAVGARLAVMTFEPHPRELFRPADPPFRLTLLRDKLEQFRRLGVAVVVVPRFDRRFAGLSPEQFIDRVLADQLGVAHVVVGADFSFGYKRSGTPAFLLAHARGRGIGAETVEPVLDPGGEAYSSTRARDALRQGDPLAAAALLGRPFAVTGRVRRGDRRGRTIGFPTANLGLGRYLRPQAGVYAVTVSGAAAGPVRGVANLGTRPTVGGTDLRLEAHLFDFSGDLYGRRLTVAFGHFLRPERAFPSLDALKHQIADDAAEARAWFAGQGRP